VQDSLTFNLSRFQLPSVNHIVEFNSLVRFTREGTYTVRIRTSAPQDFVLKIGRVVMRSTHMAEESPTSWTQTLQISAAGRQAAV
jgi:hypothetical protein